MTKTTGIARRLLTAGTILMGLTLLSLVAIGDSAQEGPTLYTQMDQVAIAAEPGGDGFGELEIVTAVTPLEAQTPSKKIEVVGWVRLDFDGNPTELMFADSEHQIRLGLINDTSQFEILEEQTRWAKVKAAGWVSNDALIDDREPLLEEGAELHTSTCGSCHSLHAAEEYESRAWPGLMQQHRDMGALGALDEGQQSLLLKYLQITAKEHSAENE